MRIISGILCAVLAVFAAGPAGAEKGLTVKGVRYFSYPGFTRIVFEAEESAAYVLTRSGDGRSLHFSSYGGPFALKVQQLPAISDGVIKGLEFRQDGEHRAVIVHLGPAAGDAKDFVLRNPDRIVVDVLRGAAVAPAPEAIGASPLLVVIDPGHGGADTGIVTSLGMEKALTLDLAKAVKKRLLKSGTKMAVLLTREQDQAMTIDERAALSNTSGALLFISLHGAAGAESRVFILDPDEGHAQASAGGPADFLGFDAVSEQQRMLWGTQQAAHSQESGRLGKSFVRAFVEREGVEPEQAPLAQLKAVDAAAVLVETGVGISRAKMAEMIVQGLERYVREKR